MDFLLMLCYKWRMFHIIFKWHPFILLMKRIILVALAIILLLVGWYLISPAFTVVESDDPSPLNHLSEGAKDMMQTEVAKMDGMQMDDDSPAAMLIQHALFRPKAHDVEGRALLLEDQGRIILRFEDFETVNGPNLHIYLAADLEGQDFIDLGEIKATKGNVNYDIPTGTDTAKYNKVLVWCVPFRVLFSYAELG
jgi:hypothetical protein